MATKLTKAAIDEAVNTIVELGGTNLRNCVQCGACSAICPGVKAGFPVLCRLLIKKLQDGHLEDIIEDSSSWGCQNCNRCTEVCPQGVRPQEVVIAFRRYQANELAINTATTSAQMQLYEIGHAVFTDAQVLRESVGLPGKAPTSAYDEAAQKEIQILMDESTMAELGLF